MKKLDIIKTTLQYTAAFGAGTISLRAARAFSPLPKGPISATALLAGRYAISGIVSKRVFDYIGEEFDDIVATFREVDSQINKEKK